MDTEEHLRFMKSALTEAYKAYESGEIPVGAVVVSNKKIIGKGYNQVQLLNDATAHAEMIALTAAQDYLGSKYLKDCTLYVTLEPCPMCGGALYETQLGSLIYAAKDPRRGFSKINPQILHSKTKISSGILEKESETLILDFFKKMRN